MTNEKKVVSKTKHDAARVLYDSDLDQMNGGIALLLPAVQQAREAARRTHSETEDNRGFSTK